MPTKKKKVLLVSAFYESGMQSLREHQYSRALTDGGYAVTLFTSTGSNVWKYSRSKMTPTIPNILDRENSAKFGFRILRRRALLRISDFFVIIPPVKLIWQSDIVHVIEFRQGFTVLVALIAKLLGKPVIYDHEQRGDRDYSILHKIDSVFRRFLIFIGSFFVDYVRHTVMANKQHYLDNSLKKAELTFAPLGADEDYFYFSENHRLKTRVDLNIGERKLLLLSGKITDIKRPIDVVKAGVSAGYYVIIIGRVDTKLKEKIAKAGGDNISFLGWQPMEDLNKYYCAADVVVFTAFSVSYWEAAATGVDILVPKSNFSVATLKNEPNFHLFGDTDMFSVEDEYIKPDYALAEQLGAVLSNIKQKPGTKRQTNPKFLWRQRRKNIIRWYQERFNV